MANEFTKCSAIFDRSKVGPGDIVSFDMLSLIRSKPIGRRVGIVKEVEAETLVVIAADEHYTEDLRELGIPIERAGELRMVYRAVHNVKKGELYGEPETDD